MSGMSNLPVKSYGYRILILLLGKEGLNDAQSHFNNKQIMCNKRKRKLFVTGMI